jgi:hypothetical protein
LCPLLARTELTAGQRTRLLQAAARAIEDPDRPQRERTRWLRMAARLGAD